MHIPSSIFSSLRPQQLIHAVLYGEVRGEPLLGQVAVAYVIRNRAELRPRLRNSRNADEALDYTNVILAWAQFSCMWESLGGTNYKAVVDFVPRVLNQGPFSIVERQLAWAATGVAANDLIDPTQGATHYYARTMSTPPAWAETTAFTVDIGNHRFFKL